ncbi:MAG: hypothetical protein ACI8UO_003764 [Verrucomicrobiales bacterium]|jgi:hypothetical protein
MKPDWRRVLVNVFIIGFVALIFIDTLPVRIGHHQQLLDAVDPVLDVTGLWQGPWELFAPNVDAENHRIQVEIEFEDGLVETWTSPDWTETTCWEKFHGVREIEFYDRIRNRSNCAAWGEFARYTAGNVESKIPAVAARLFVLSKIVPPPGEPAPTEWTRTHFHSEPLSR